MKKRYVCEGTVYYVVDIILYILEEVCEEEVCVCEEGTVYYVINIIVYILYVEYYILLIISYKLHMMHYE